MKVLVGECTGGYVPEIQRLGWGRMWIARDRLIYTYPGEPWGFDNGAYRDWQKGVPFSEETYLKALERAKGQPEPPYLAVIPDIPAGGVESLRFSESWVDRMPDGWPLYLAVQDGMTPADTVAILPRLAGLFLGGTNAFKAQAQKWCEFAHGHGLKFHYGRCGSLNKLTAVVSGGISADSLDSAFPMWTKERWALFEESIRNGPIQQDLIWGAEGREGNS